MDELLEQKLKQQQEQAQQEKQEPAYKQLETWAVPQEALQETKENFVKSTTILQQEHNMALRARMQQQVPVLKPETAAPVEHPPVQQAPVNESRKAQREREKKRKAAQKICPVGDENTFDMVHSVKELLTGKDNSYTPDIDAAAEQSHSDKRMLKVFSYGYRKNWLGRPASNEDKARMLADQKFLKDYTSGDAELRRPHLEQITKEMLSIKLTPEMLSDDYMHRNAAQNKDLGDRMTYFENMQKENPAFFDALPQLQKDQLNNLQNLFLPFVSAVSQSFNAKGVNFNYGTFYDKEELPGIQMGLDMRDPMIDVYHQALDTFKADSAKSVSNEADRVCAQYETQMQVDSQQMIGQIKAEGGAFEDIKFTSNVTTYQYDDLAKARKLIDGHPTEYAKNKELLDQVYSEYYKCLDIFGGMTFQSRVLQASIDDNNDPQKDTFMKRELVGTLLDRQEKLSAQQGLFMNRLAGMSDILNHYLRGKELSAGARGMLPDFQQKTGQQ